MLMRSRELLGPAGPVASEVEGYELRDGQLEMAEAVERTLEEDGLLLVEAGTGTGKTLAYLVPALLSGKKVVISTGTKTLQDQLMQSDIPLLLRCFGDVQVACMKGLGNYLCLRRYHELLASADADQEPLATLLPTLTEWEAETLTGDHAELAKVPESSALWAAVRSGSDTRIGAKCAHYNRCYVTAMRTAAEHAQIVVVNHHLFFADLAMRGGHNPGVLPEYDAVIFDEAHLIDEIATDFFGLSVTQARLEVLVRDARRGLVRAGTRLDWESLLANVQQRASNFFGGLPTATEAGGGRVRLDTELFASELREPMFALDSALDALASHCRHASPQDEAMASLARRAHKLRQDVNAIAEGGGRTHITWTRASGESRGGRRNVAIGASPIEVGPALRDRLWYSGHAAVLTSATLSTAGSFEFARARLGVDFEPHELIVASPFDYGLQAALYCPRHVGDPRTPEFKQRALHEIRALVRLTGGGAFVLCTSLRAMRTFAAQCCEGLPGPVYVQGQAPKAVLLERFRQAGNGVLFATSSFWQGVDVPGEALRLVIIDKLPFEVPTDPLVAARCERMRQEQGQDPFRHYVVPAAALALKQGFGRLIRSRRDRGIVAVLDARLRTRGYGKWFLRTLPPARRCEQLEEVRKFWHARSEPVTESGTV